MSTTTRILSGPELRVLSKRSNLSGAIHTGLHAAVILSAGALVVHAGPWMLVPSMLFLGVAQATLFAPIHETMHLTAFVSRRCNVWVGWLAACPSLLNYHFYTAFHLAHHRHTQDPALDPELDPLPPSALDGYLVRVVALPYWRTRLRVVAAGLRGDLSAFHYITPRAAPRIIASIRWMIATVVAGSALSIVFVGWWAPLLFWIIPQLLGQPFLRLYLLTEHTGCTLDANGLTNTRTTLTNALMRLAMWNMSFHAEHHLYPSIPFHRLPDAHLAIRDHLGVVQRGYTRWHRQFLAALR